MEGKKREKKTNIGNTFVISIKRIKKHYKYSVFSLYGKQCKGRKIKLKRLKH